MEDSPDSVRELGLLEEIERDPDTTQASMADRLGVAVGTVNWHVKRLIAKGYVKVKRAERRKLRYIITPEGIAERAKLTVAYIENSMHLYRQTRQQAVQVLQQARERGFNQVMIQGDGDIADVCRLTSIEQGMSVVESGEEGPVAVILIDGRELILKDPAD
ncbi:MAG: winged helix-turn-helix transcriptional regulator [Anaerolineales bacterium]|nr:winged helix-turn-helix transcriptional regulator [Anaerolineales bacterium]